MKRHFVLALVLTCVGPLQSATLERLTLDDMIVKATGIVRGRVAESWTGFTGPVIYTHYTLQVSERFKGTGGATVEVVVPGGIASGLRQSFAGAPQFKIGEEYVFFLWTGKSGLTQVVGLTQGLFAIAADGSIDPAVTRSASRELMLEAGTGRQVKGETLSMPLSDLRARIAATLAAGGAAR